VNDVGLTHAATVKLLAALVPAQICKAELMGIETWFVELALGNEALDPPETPPEFPVAQVTAPAKVPSLLLFV
jgi:hypothetical protein